MFRHLLPLVVFLAGLAVVCWVGVAYVGSSPLGTGVALLIAACYVAGALELYRYRQATASLQHALEEVAGTSKGLTGWLGGLHPSLRHAVRLRIEGERVALPAPAMTPYLVGLLVLLGMLGTLLGMMATLRGTGMALESASDIQAIRGALAAPVKGLGFAFGTSIAGVGTSAMLGLLSALCRRERLQAVQALDLAIATHLRVHSRSHQREEAFRLLQQQTEAMPVLVDRLQAMASSLEQRDAASGERQLAGQEAFRTATGAAFERLAASVEQSLKDSVAEGARAAGDALQPVVAATLAGLAREGATLHGHVREAVQQQLDGLSSGFAATTTNVADIWKGALTEQQRANEALAQELRASLQGFAETFEQRSSGLLDTIASRLDATAGGVSDAWEKALARQGAVNAEFATQHRQTVTAATKAFDEQAASLLASLDRSHMDLQTTLQSRDDERLARWNDAISSMAAELTRRWEQAGDDVATRQQAICDTLARTASEVTAEAQAHASATIKEIATLVQAASEAPKAAAEVVAELRQKLSDSMVRDNAMLEERGRLLATLETLLDAVNHASTEQRTAVDALVTTSADLLDRVGTRFADDVEAGTSKLDAASAQLAGSAMEVASLGDAFGTAVTSFGESNDALMERLQAIADALDRSLVRSDEQLAYYVAQAREVVDLSVLSQKQIVEDLQRLAADRAASADTSA